MTVDLLPLLIALVLLWFPRQFLRLGWRVGIKSRTRRAKDASNERGPEQQTVNLLSEIGKLRNYVDFGRAALGSAVVFGTSYTDACIRGTAGAPAGTARLLFASKLAILVVALVLQMVRVERSVKLFAPIFFLTGVSFGLCGLKIAGFAAVMIWAINLAGMPAAGFLFVHAWVLMMFSMLFNGTNLLKTANIQTMIAAGLVAAPALVSWMAREQLVHFTKKAKSAEEFSGAS